jgi:hypothetical protein
MLTRTELNVLPDAIAIIAVVAGYLGVRSANRGQASLARESYRRDRLTETYLDLLKGVHLRNAQLDDSYRRPIGKPSRTPTELDPTTDDETRFGARLMAYASPEVDQQWGDFALLTTRLDNMLIDARNAFGLPPADLTGAVRQPVETMFDEWNGARDRLQALVRSELRDPP